MANKIVLISDDTDFFDYIKAKLALRKSDELFTFSYEDALRKSHMLSTSVILADSENSKDKTLNLLNIFKGTPVIVFAFNEDEAFKINAYKSGMFDYINILISDRELQSRIVPALAVSAMIKKNKCYRDILVRNNIIFKNNEVFIDYNFIIDNKLSELAETSQKAVFMAISPNDKTKYILKPEIIETTILNNIRKNDILMTFAPNKYFLILFDADIDSAAKLWNKIGKEIPQKIYAGISAITNQKRQQLINEVLNKLHEAINYDKDNVNEKSVPLSMLQTTFSSCNNFKQFRHEFGKKLEQVITPVFYRIQQKYSEKLPGVILEQGSGDGYGSFYIKGKHSNSSFRITSPGFSKINIDITFQKDSSNIDAKRITLEPEELEQGLLGDLLEQFISEYKKEALADDHT